MFSNKSILLFFIVIGAGLLSIFISSCEEEKPIEASDDLTMTVVTNDESGQSVPDVEVSLKSNDGSYSKKVVSDSQGLSLFSLKDINCSNGDKFTLEITPPFGSEISGGCLYEDVIILCCDTLIVCDGLSRNVLVAECDSSTYITEIEFDLCYENGETLTRNSRIYTNNTGDTWTVSSQTPTIPNFSIQTMNITNPAPANQTTIAPDEKLQFKFTFNPKGEVMKFNDTYQFTAKDDNGNTCINGQINISAQADTCSYCQCPPKIETVMKFKESVCLSEIGYNGEIYEYEINLDTLKLQNPYDDCTWYFTAITNNLGSEFELLSDDFSISKIGTANIYNLKVRFNPSTAKIYKENLIFLVSKKGAFAREDCNDSLRIEFELEATEIDCSNIVIDYSKITSGLENCAGVSKDYYVSVTNPGICPTEVICTITGPDKGSFSFNELTNDYNISETVDTTFVFKTYFYPKMTSVWPNGRPLPPYKLNYQAYLNIEFPDCPSRNIRVELNGIADTTCGDAYSCQTIWGEDNTENGFLFFTTEDLFKYVVDTQGAKDNLHLFINSVILVGGSPTANIGTSGNIQKVVNPEEPDLLCSMVNTIDPPQSGELYDICNNGPWSPTGDVNIQEGDYFIINVNNGCILGWVSDIIVNSQNDWIVCFNFCINYKLY